MTRAHRKLIAGLALFASFAIFALFAPISPALAAPDCPATGCTATEVGPFMAGISEACGEKGTCSLADIETVFANVGNWVLGVVGAFVLLAYVVGGFYFLISGMPGMEKYREKGKTALKQSTVGLVIVFVAFAALTTLKSVLMGGGIATDGTQYVSCGPGDTNAGLACGLNSTCTDSGLCVSKCEQRNSDEAFMENDQYVAGFLYMYACVDVTASATNYGMADGFTLNGSFEKNLCPGDNDVQCGQFVLQVY